MLALEGFNWGSGLSDAWTSVASAAPKVVAFVATLIIGTFVAKILRRVVSRLLDRVGFPTLVHRAGLSQALSGGGVGPSKFVAKLAYYALMLLVVTAAFAVFGSSNPISQYLTSVVAYLPRVFVAIAIVVVAGYMSRVVRDLASGALSSVPNGQTMAKAAGIAVTVLGAFAALNQLRIAPAIVNGLFYAGLAVIVGSAIIAIGGGGIGPMRAQWEKRLNRGNVDLRGAGQPQAPAQPQRQRADA